MQLLWNSVFNSTFYFPKGEEKKKKQSFASCKFLQNIWSYIRKFIALGQHASKICLPLTDVLCNLKAKIFPTK